MNVCICALKQLRVFANILLFATFPFIDVSSLLLLITPFVRNASSSIANSNCKYYLLYYLLKLIRVQKNIYTYIQTYTCMYVNNWPLSSLKWSECPKDQLILIRILIIIYEWYVDDVRKEMKIVLVLVNFHEFFFIKFYTLKEFKCWNKLKTN